MALLVRRDVEAIVVAIQTVQSLFQTQILDRISTLTVVDHELRPERAGAPAATSQEIADLIAGWERTLKIG